MKVSEKSFHIWLRKVEDDGTNASKKHKSKLNILTLIINCWSGGVVLQIHVFFYENTEPEKMACTWFGEISSCCSLTALLGPVWVLLNYVLQTIFSGPVQKS